MKWRCVIAAGLLLTVVLVSRLYLTGRFRFLTNTGARVEVNGIAVRGELYGAQRWADAILVRRDLEQPHAYVINFEGDIDPTGDMGSVVDCHGWIPPATPMLLETS